MIGVGGLFGAHQRGNGWRSAVTAAVVPLTLLLAAAPLGGCGGRRAEPEAAAEWAEAPFAAGRAGAADQGGAVQAEASSAQDSRAEPTLNVGGKAVVQHEAAGLAAPRYDAAGAAALLAGRKLVRNADLAMEVTDMDVALARLEAIASTAGGIVAASSIYTSPGSPDEPRPLEGGAGGQAGPGPRAGAGAGAGAGTAVHSGPPREGNVTLRVPVDRFDQALTAVRRVGRLVRESVESRDATAQYVDLEARALSLEEQERRLRALVGRSDKLDELLRLENELARVRGEIESLRGQLRSLEEQSDFSTIGVSLRETVLASPRLEPPRGVGDRAARAFLRAANAVLQAGAGLVVALAAVLPVAAAVGGPAAGGWLVYRALRRRVRGREAPTA